MNDRIRNAALNAREYAAEMLVLESSPPLVYVELTQNCNLHCVMCRSGGKYRPTLDMQPETFAIVLRDLVPQASMVDLRGWGESTILKDFPTRLRQVAESGVRVRLVTNALNMSDAVWDTIFDTDGVVLVSVDAATQETCTALGRGDLGKVMVAVERGQERRAKVGRGTLYVNTVVSSRNADELAAIVARAGSLGIPKVMFTPVRVSPTDPLNLDRTVHRLPDILAEVERTAKGSGVCVQLGAALHPDLVDAAGLPSVCANPWTDVVVSYNGDILFCDHLIGHPEYATGNLTRQGFRAVWNGAPFVRLRQAHLAARLSREVGVYQKCTWCYHNRYGESETSPGIDSTSRMVWLGNASPGALPQNK